MTQYWEPGTQYNYGDIVEYEGSRYKIIQPHRSQGDWTPPVTPALWGRLQNQDCGQNQQPYNQQPNYQAGYQQPQNQYQQSGKPEHKEESRFDEAKDWVSDHKKELGIGAALAAGVGAYAYHKHNEKEKEEQKHQQQQQKPQYIEQGQSWAAQHEDQLKIAGGIAAATAVAAGGAAYYKHHENQKAEQEHHQKPQQQPQFLDQAKNWAGEHETQLKVAGGIAAGAAVLAGGVAYHKHQKEKEEEERRHEHQRPQQQRPPSPDDKPWYKEHKTELGVGAALVGAGAAYAYHKHNEKEEKEQRVQQQSQSGQGKSWVEEHEHQLKVGAGVAAATAVAAGGAAYYKHHEHEKAEQKYQSEITHLEEKTTNLHLDEDRKHKLKIAGGVAAGAAVAGGAYALYKRHEDSEEQKVFARNEEHWLQEAKERTDRFYQHGPNGPITWVLTRGPNIPQGAIEVSKEHQWSLHICRTFYDGGIQPGKASGSFPQGGVIAYGDKEIHIGTYEVLLGDMRELRWVPARGKLNPASLGYKPVEGGCENNGTRLYIAKAEYDGVFHPGKASDVLDGAHIPYGGGEKNIKEYFVLCYN